MDGMTKEEESTFIQEAKDRFAEIEAFESPARTKMLADLVFQYRDQWNPKARKKRDGENRPCITIRRTNQFTDHIKNEQRQSKPQIKVSPVDDGAQEVYARRRQGLIRHIQYDSRAEQAFQRSYDFAVDMGRGWFKISTEYIGGKSFDQKIVIEPIRDQFSVYMDHRHQYPDYSDCKYGFQVDRISRKAFQEAYPDNNPCSWNASMSDNSWINKDDILLAEYYCVKNRPRELWELEIDGVKSKVYKDELEDHKDARRYLVRDREVNEQYVTWHYMSPNEVLAEKELLCGWIPLIPVIGKETIINGVLDIKGIIRDLMDPAQMYNFWSSQETEIISNAPKAPYIGAKGQFEGFEATWGQANDSSFAYLEYNPVTHSGQLAPPPQRQPFAGVPVGIVNAKAQIIEDMKAITGLYDASMGNRTNETSGVAIKNRQGQGETANFHYPDNYATGLTQAGRIINKMIPHYYSDERTVTILGEDDEEEQIKVGEMDEKGEPVGFGDGDFAVVVSVGPSFTTKREEASANMIDMAKNVPLIGEGAADLIVKAQDWPMKDEIAERAKRLLEGKYPGLTAPMKNDSEDEKIAALMQQMQQMDQQMQQMAMERQQLVEQLQGIDQQKNAAEAQKVQVEIAKLDIEQKKVAIDAGKLDLEAQKIQVDMDKARLDSDTKIYIEKMKLDKDVALTMHQDEMNQKNAEKPTDAQAVATQG
jgi:hypothetical protein